MSQPIFNLHLLRELTDGNAELEAELVKLFAQTARRCISRLQTLASLDTHNEWAEVVHELKGAAYNLQAAQLATLCSSVEKLPNDPTARIQAVAEIKQAYMRLKPLLEALGPLQ